MILSDLYVTCSYMHMTKFNCSHWYIIIKKCRYNARKFNTNERINNNNYVYDYKGEGSDGRMVSAV